MALQLNQREIAQLNKSLTDAYAATVERLHDRAIEYIEADRWSWPRVTRRQNGSVVGSPRDIVDTGDLLRSQDVEFVSSDNINLVNTADHAPAVAFGYRRGRTIVPGRDWMGDAIEDSDPVEIFRDEWEKRV